jgi:hypothetical protein
MRSFLASRRRTATVMSCGPILTSTLPVSNLAHGDPFEGFPVAGLLELTRDLIGFAYRDMLS